MTQQLAGEVHYNWSMLDRYPAAESESGMAAIITVHAVRRYNAQSQLSPSAELHVSHVVSRIMRQTEDPAFRTSLYPRHVNDPASWHPYGIYADTAEAIGYYLLNMHGRPTGIGEHGAQNLIIYAQLATHNTQ